MWQFQVHSRCIDMSFCSVVLLAHHWRYHSLVFRFPEYLVFLKFYYRASMNLLLLRICFRDSVAWCLSSVLKDFCHYFFKYNSCPSLTLLSFWDSNSQLLSLSFHTCFVLLFPYFFLLYSFLPSFFPPRFWNIFHSHSIFNTVSKILF